MTTLFFVFLFLVLFKQIILVSSIFPMAFYYRFKRNRQFQSSESVSPPLVRQQKGGITGRIKLLCSGYFRYNLFQIAYIPSHIIRDFLYKKVCLVEIGPKAVIYFGAEIRRGEHYWGSGGFRCAKWNIDRCECQSLYRSTYLDRAA